MAKRDWYDAAAEAFDVRWGSGPVAGQEYLDALAAWFRDWPRARMIPAEIDGMIGETVSCDAHVDKVVDVSLDQLPDGASDEFFASVAAAGLAFNKMIRAIRSPSIAKMMTDARDEEQVKRAIAIVREAGYYVS